MTTMSPEGRRPDRKLEKRSEKKPDERSRTPRLDLPRELRSPVLGRILDRATAPDQDRLGRFAERFARFLGTARFLIYMTLVVVVWIGWNWLAPEGARFDAYPFIFLTLILSLQASYAAPLILLAQNRQELRDRVVTEQDRQANARAHADMEFLAREVASLRMALGEVATRDFLRSELRDLLEELEERQRAEDSETELAPE
ncbi:putative membrane protein [Marmoricola sp. URHA0025 HA25]